MSCHIFISLDISFYSWDVSRLYLNCDCWTVYILSHGLIPLHSRLNLKRRVRALARTAVMATALGMKTPPAPAPPALPSGMDVKSNHIRNVEVQFPFEPYECQVSG